MPYDAFISYSHADCKDIAAPIQKALQNIGKPWYKELSTNLKIYRDQTDLTATPGLWSKIEIALKDSNFFILLASPTAAVSGWIKDEINVWLQKNYDNKAGIKKMFIVLCDGEIEWDKNAVDFNWDKTNCLPMQLSQKFKDEPLWIDLRNYIKNNTNNQKIINYQDFGFSEQIAKVIGGIIDKAPAKIISKELLRVKKLRNIYVAAVLTLLVLLIASISLFIGQRNSNTQLKIETNLAELQRDTAINNLRKFKVEEYNKNVRNGRIYLDAEEYCFAKQVLDSAKKTIDTPLYDTLPEILKDKAMVLKLDDSCTKKCVQ
jgi:hypothetical protein